VRENGLFERSIVAHCAVPVVDGAARSVGQKIATLSIARNTDIVNDCRRFIFLCDNQDFSWQDGYYLA